MDETCTPTILVADDEETVRSYIRNILTRRGYRLIEAQDGVDALEKLGHSPSPVALVLTDVRMPRMGGIALADAVFESSPRTPVVYISGYPLDLETEKKRHPQTACAYLPKPFTPKVLVETVERCLHAAPAVRTANS